MSQLSPPLVSVIITTFHNEVYLPRAIESVLHQTYPNIELIVVDDNPPDSDARRKTQQVMTQYPDVIYLKHPQNRNGAAARNTGILRAAGQYIAFLDNDDIYFSDHIASCVQALQENPGCAGVLTGVVKVCGGLCWERVLPPTGDLVQALLFHEAALGTGSNLFVATDAVRALNGFDERFIRHQDVEFALRLFSRFKVCTLDAVQIIKEMDGYSNVPDFSRFLATKQMLWDTFSALIHALSEAQQRQYFANQYSSLLYIACKANDLRQIAWTLDKLRSFRPISAKERLMVSLSRVRLFRMYESAKKQVKRVQSPEICQSTAGSLSAYDQAIFQQVLRDGKRSHS